MRIIAGQFRGVPIAAPKGDTTRPTIDRVRESLMSSLNSALCGFEGVVALDAFAGSGALGLELLSRGAKSVCFYDADTEAYNTVCANAQKLKLDRSQAVIRKQDVLKNLPTYVQSPFHLVLLDPPYALPAKTIFDFLDEMYKKGALHEEVVVSYEHAKKDTIEPLLSECEITWKLRAHKVFGETVIDIFERQNA